MTRDGVIIDMNQPQENENLIQLFCTRTLIFKYIKNVCLLFAFCLFISLFGALILTNIDNLNWFHYKLKLNSYSSDGYSTSRVYIFNDMFLLSETQGIIDGNYYQKEIFIKYEEVYFGQSIINATTNMYDDNTPVLIDRDFYVEFNSTHIYVKDLFYIECPVIPNDNFVKIDVHEIGLLRVCNFGFTQRGQFYTDCSKMKNYGTKTFNFFSSD